MDRNTIFTKTAKGLGEATGKTSILSRDLRNILSVQELEQRLDPRKFIRIHRATLVNIDSVHELHAWFAGRMMLRLKDEKKTELAVSRDRVRALKQRLGI